MARAWNAAARAARSTAAWLDFGLAVLVACGERLRAPAAEAAAEPALVAQAITVRAGEAFVTPVHFPGQANRRVISPAATLAIAAAALAATLGARSAISSGYGPGVAAFAGDPSFFALRAPVHAPGAHHDPGLARTVVTIEATAAPLEAAAYSQPALADAALLPVPIAVELAGREAAASEDTEPEAIVAVAAAAADPEPVAAASPEATVVPVAPPVPVAEVSAFPAALPAYVGLRYTADQVRSIALGAGWPAAVVDNLLDVAWCESRFRPDASGQGALGLMQLMPFWFRVAGVGLEQWSDPLVNLRVALVAYENDLNLGREAWFAWSCKPQPRSGS